jgi:hypothetical protein
MSLSSLSVSGARYRHYRTGIDSNSSANIITPNRGNAFLSRSEEIFESDLFIVDIVILVK